MVNRYYQKHKEKRRKEVEYMKNYYLANKK